MHLIWFRNDLRINDNPALFNAAKDESEPLVAVYLEFSEQWDKYGIGDNPLALKRQSVIQLKKSLEKNNIPLLVFDAKKFSNAPSELEKLCNTLNVQQLFFNLEYGWDERQRDKSIVEKLSPKVVCSRHVGDSLVPPWEIVNNQEQGYKVFSAFARVVRERVQASQPNVLPTVKKRKPDNLKISSTKSKMLDQAFAKKFLESAAIKSHAPIPDISEEKAQKKLARFCEDDLQSYTDTRDYPSIDGTSTLSAELAAGVISANQCYQYARTTGGELARKWLDELIWRDFYRAVMWHYPRVSRNCGFTPVDKQIHWNQSEDDFAKFEKAETGIPIIDAAIQQLLQTGWMHNRLRMVVASYLTKNLWIDWRQGEVFFAKHLFDYDFASNNGGWQWCASTGTDAAPYFRIFNPQSQQVKFDAEARFIKSWLPQLKSIDAKTIHKFETKSLPDYPQPQVDLKATRKLAIEQFKLAKEAAGN